MTRRAAVWCVVALAVVAAIWAKVRIEAGHSLARAQAFEADDDVQLAVALYRQTVRWYSPGSGPVAEAVARLEALGQAAERDGRPSDALAAYRALRAGLFGIRSVYQPYEDRLAPLNARIAALMAAQEGASPGSDDFAGRAAFHEALLAVDRAPSVGWSLAAVLGFLAWIACLFGLALRGFDELTGALRRGPAVRWFGGVVATAAVWMVALALA